MTIIGTAGWSIPTAQAHRFAPEGSALQRYASRFAGVEVNSSFHRSHRPSTWANWAASVPDGFGFAVKLPKEITHRRKLVDCAAPLDAFFAEIAGLGDKLSVVLVQLPPSLAFDRAAAAVFFRLLAAATPVQVACEPRHATWFDGEADALLDDAGVARVAADPARVPAAAGPGGWRGFGYWRLHGSPDMYRSSYDEDRLADYASRLEEERKAGRSAWCMFDNTAASAATANALDLSERLSGHR